MLLYLPCPSSLYIRKKCNVVHVCTHDTVRALPSVVSQAALRTLHVSPRGELFLLRPTHNVCKFSLDSSGYCKDRAKSYARPVVAARFLCEPNRCCNYCSKNRFTRLFPGSFGTNTHIHRDAYAPEVDFSPILEFSPLVLGRRVDLMNI